MLESVRLEQFRTFTDKTVQFGQVTVITGKNGAGKTSVLEAVAMLSLTTSWKTETDSEAIQWEQPFTRVTAGNTELVIQASPYLKRVRVDGISKRVAQVIGLMPTILFQPEDTAILYGAPSYRRQYLDRILSQTSPAYTQAAIQLTKVLKQRNRLLKNIADGLSSEDELLFWDEQLAGVQIIMKAERERFVAWVGERMPGVFAEMVPGGKVVTMHYHESPHGHTHSFLEHLKLNRSKEIMAGSTLYGPHREDFEFFWGEHPVRESMSRGQARSLLVACKIAELEYVHEHNQEKPILLLDDIFSELDAERRERLMLVFGEYQVIMTTTELGAVEGILGKGTEVVELG